MPQYKIKVSTPTAFHWVTKTAQNAEIAKTLALGGAAGKYGCYVSECVEVKREASDV